MQVIVSNHQAAMQVHIVYHHDQSPPGTSDRETAREEKSDVRGQFGVDDRGNLIGISSIFDVRRMIGRVIAWQQAELLD
jgi:hypothetical protein